MKNTIIVSALLVCVISIAVSVYHNKTAFEAKGALNGERYSRMVAEEELLKATEKVSSLQKELASVKSRLQKNETLLEQTLSVKDDLQARLDEAVKQKDNLERKVKDLGQALNEKMTAVNTGEI